MTEPLLPKEEYAALHAEAANCMTELGSLERGCVISAAAVLAWLATNAEGLVSFAGLVWAVPVGIAIYGSLRALAIRRHIAALAEYLRDLEAPGGGGSERWQRYFASRWRTRAKASAVAWLVFIGLTVAGSTLGYLQFRSECPGPLASACSKEDNGEAEEEQQRLKLGTHVARADR